MAIFQFALSRIIIGIGVLVGTIFTVAYAYTSGIESDITAFRTCLGTGSPLEGMCINADLDGDGSVNLTDWGLFRNVILVADFSGDMMIDFRDIPENDDMNLILGCFDQSPLVDVCTRIDLNEDGIVDQLDVDMYNELIKYDITGDSIFNFYMNSAPQFVYQVPETVVDEGERIGFYLVARDTETSPLTYEVIEKPASSITEEIVYGDLTKDGVVDINDSNEIDIRIIDFATEESFFDAKYDLNNDKAIDILDKDIITEQQGKYDSALLFTFVTSIFDSGTYTLKVAATDDIQATIISSTIAVNDLDAWATYDYYNDVLVVINDASSASQEIGEYFVAERSIPAFNVVHINTPAVETITRTVFESDVRIPIEQYMVSENLVDGINYIVTTKGVPLRVNGATYTRSSVDSELALINGIYSKEIGKMYTYQSPYYQANTPFSHEMYDFYLVTRLTGYTVEDAKKLIDNASTTTATGTIVLDRDSTKDGGTYNIGNIWMEDAAVVIENKGYPVFFDETTTFITDRTDVLGYTSWGSNDANDTNNAKPNFTWTPGAIAETYVSSSGRTFTAPPVYGQSLIADLVAEGVTGAKGYVFEPYLAAMAQPYILFDRYLDGYNLADSYFMASKYVSWMGVVVGDPKTRITNPSNPLFVVRGAEGGDFTYFRNCFGELAENECAVTDLDGDGIVGFSDFGLFRSASKFNLNSDFAINLLDFSLFRACFGKVPENECFASDFNADGFINLSDFSLFRAAITGYDFNGNGVVTFD